MRKFIADIDRLLRGGFTEREELESGNLRVPIRTLATTGLILGGLYGAFMGLFTLMRGGPGSAMQIVATTLKVPLLFLLTLAVTFPSLYVFSALTRSRLFASSTLRLLLAAVAINLAVLASFGPITGFFTLSTTSYAFMIVLNVVFFGTAGLIGISFLRKALRVVFAPARPPRPAPTPPPPVDEAIATHPPAPRPPVASPADPAGLVFRVWAILFGIVGAQMAWVLRPFVGAPGLPFEWFRARQSNFFAAVLSALRHLFQ